MHLKLTVQKAIRIVVKTLEYQPPEDFKKDIAEHVTPQTDNMKTIEQLEEELRLAHAACAVSKDKIDTYVPDMQKHLESLHQDERSFAASWYILGRKDASRVLEDATPLAAQQMVERMGRMETAIEGILPLWNGHDEKCDEKGCAICELKKALSTNPQPAKEK